MSTVQPETGSPLDVEPVAPWSRRRVLAAALAIPMYSTAGCSLLGAVTAPVPQPTPGHDDTSVAVIVVGAHANAPAPTLTSEDEDTLAKTMSVGGTVAVVAAAGVPSVVPERELHLRPVKGTPAGQQKLIQGNLELIKSVVAAQSPASDGADAWEAVAQAAGQIRSQRGRNPVIILLDSGLNDRGRLNFTATGMPTADPGDVVAHIKQQLPDLHGITVRLSGIGYTTAPQQPLDQVNRDNVIAIWKACLKAAGAQVVVDAAPRSGASVDSHGHSVKTVDLPAVDSMPATSCKPSEIVFASQSAVSFRPDVATFRDRDRAHQALKPIARWLASDSRRSAVIRGTTADDGSPQYRQRRLGRRRAQRVADYLRRNGVRPNQLTVKGVGSDFPEYLRPDRDKNGLLPGPAALNRAVRITLTDPC